MPRFFFFLLCMLFVNLSSECNLVYSREPTDETYADDFLNKNEVDIIEPAKLDVSDEVRDAVLLLSVFVGMVLSTVYSLGEQPR